MTELKYTAAELALFDRKFSAALEADDCDYDSLCDAVAMGAAVLADCRAKLLASEAETARIRKAFDEVLAVDDETIIADAQCDTAEQIAAFVLSDPHHCSDLTDPSCPIGLALTDLAAAIRAGSYKPEPGGD